MRIRPAELADLERLMELDATIESERYLHVGREGEGLAATWRLEERPLREKRVDNNAAGDELRFSLKQLLSGVEEGIVLAAEHDEQLVGLAAARHNVERKTLDVVDVRVDYDLRREGIGIAMLFQIIAKARELGVRAVTAVTQTNNLPAANLLQKSGFDLCGVDTHFSSNHDLVKETVAMFWYAALD